MILKICRKKIIEDNVEGKVQVITEFHNCNSFKESNGIIEVENNKQIIISDFDGLDEITNKSIHYETIYAFLMNDEGKTIERLA